jgi:vitamin B12 transporter
MTRATLYRSAAIAALGLALPLVAQADDSPQVIVTAARLPAPAASTPDAHVITEADIEAGQAIFASDVLSTVPGLVIVPTGAFGGVTGVSIRGATTDKTLVLIDGVPVNDASQPEGGFDFGALDLGDVARIEILTGPQGALWGSNAIGGVIAFTTKEPNGIDAAIEGGSLSTWRGSLSVGRSTDGWALGGTLAGFTTDGVSAADARNAYAPFGAPSLHNTEADGDQMLTASLRGRLTLSDAVQLDGLVRYNHARTAIDGFPPPDFLFSDTNDVQISESVEAFARAHVGGPWGLKNELSVSDAAINRGDHGESGAFGFHAQRQVYRWTVQAGGPDDRYSAVVGAEREATSANLSTGQTFDLSASSVFALGQARPLPGFTGVVGVRYDAPDRFRAQTTVRVGSTYELPWGFSVQGSFDQGFKTPTISETACDFCFAPPVRLRAEHAQGYDGALAWRATDGKASLKATAFALDVTDEIAFAAGRYINIARARSRGVEVEAEAALPWGFRVQASYSYIDAINAQTGVRLLRVPLNSGSASLFWMHGRWDAAFTVRAEDADHDTGLDFSRVIRPGFGVADLAGGFRLNEHLRLTARVRNLTGEHYEQAFGFGEPGRTFTVGLRFKE